jgi:predicted TIM-barrel fold metal-dependent hydrolase
LLASIIFGSAAAASLSGCAGRLQSPPQSPPPGPAALAQIIPLVDHHQHIFGPSLVDPPTRVLPPVQLPPDLARTLAERERISGTRDLGDLFAEDAQVLNTFFETEHWVTGRDEIAGIVEQHGRGARFVPNAYSADGSAAFISGIVHIGSEGEYDKHFSIGLKRDRDGGWRIVSESVTDKTLNPFTQPLDAKQLIMRLDDAGIQRAAVLSTSYWLARRLAGRPAGEIQQRVQEANDWVVEQTAAYPDRLVPFCGVSPLWDFAVAELRRCGRLERVRGIKLHFANARVDLHDQAHLDKVRAVFRAANESKMAIVVHFGPRGPRAVEAARIFLEQVIAQAPDVPVQIAHLGSGAGEDFDRVLGVFADAAAAGDPRMRNVYFDVTEVISEDLSEKIVARVAERIRQIGTRHILFGSDTPLPRFRPPPLQAWATFRRRVPLTVAEIEQIAANVAPYMR